jgi:hypothetical protein
LKRGDIGTKIIEKALLKTRLARHQWLTSVIPAIQEAEVRKMVVQSQPSQIVCKPLSRKYPTHTHKGPMQWLKW